MAMPSSKAKEKKKKPRRKGQSPTGRAADVACSFCGGEGRDPFGVMSALATCQVCGGTGRRALRQPTASCAFCRGTGVHPGSRMVCTSCDGVGTVEVAEAAAMCPCCSGTGRAGDDPKHSALHIPLSCVSCGGKGLVAP
jgi:DnaJ-class molecular chaperone